MSKTKRSGTFAITLFVVALWLASWACGNPAPEHVLRGWTLTPSPTFVVAQATQTPHIVQETIVVAQVITTTPEPTGEPVVLCVVAQEAVNLRPSPSEINYPILSLEKGQEVTDLQGRSGVWHFYRVTLDGQDFEGWINSQYIGICG